MSEGGSEPYSVDFDADESQQEGLDTPAPVDATAGSVVVQQSNPVADKPVQAERSAGAPQAVAPATDRPSLPPPPSASKVLSQPLSTLDPLEAQRSALLQSHASARQPTAEAATESSPPGPFATTTQHSQAAAPQPPPPPPPPPAPLLPHSLTELHAEYAPRLGVHALAALLPHGPAARPLAHPPWSATRPHSPDPSGPRPHGWDAPWHQNLRSTGVPPPAARVPPAVRRHVPTPTAPQAWRPPNSHTKAAAPAAPLARPGPRHHFRPATAPAVAEDTLNHVRHIRRLQEAHYAAPVMAAEMPHTTLQRQRRYTNMYVRHHNLPVEFSFRVQDAGGGSGVERDSAAAGRDAVAVTALRDALKMGSGGGQGRQRSTSRWIRSLATNPDVEVLASPAPYSRRAPLVDRPDLQLM